ncbi:protein HEAT-STRESS-ASSOCIATED 32 [Colletotrichum spaethianum]|uniref:Protein HEAT-STRESS-ASSOCIATED 32 n=1 Tax=Colletotrichum spaethianum TaxID=700344 RepID=A0AA37LBH0_9PEZI|nr:protein HEAT-STRESS-ASSOCIATED 32 [Colletotrichum spaethianum]GKT43499.1 protein HEAT-STRESS-ASSOCIATED 32 [Colletotrichum spaethianum]
MVLDLGKNFVAADVERIMIESKDITINVEMWRTDMNQKIMRDLPLNKAMLDTRDPVVFNWYLRKFGIDVNLFVDHFKIVQLSGLRAGVWGMADTFGKITTFR